MIHLPSITPSILIFTIQYTSSETWISKYELEFTSRVLQSACWRCITRPSIVYEYLQARTISVAYETELSAFPGSQKSLGRTNKEEGRRKKKIWKKVWRSNRSPVTWVTWVTVVGERQKWAGARLQEPHAARSATPLAAISLVSSYLYTLPGCGFLRGVWGFARCFACSLRALHLDTPHHKCHRRSVHVTYARHFPGRPSWELQGRSILHVIGEFQLIRGSVGNRVQKKNGWFYGNLEV